MALLVDDDDGEGKSDERDDGRLDSIMAALFASSPGQFLMLEKGSHKINSRSILLERFRTTLCLRSHCPEHPLFHHGHHHHHHQQQAKAKTTIYQHRSRKKRGKERSCWNRRTYRRNQNPKSQSDLSKSVLPGLNPSSFAYFDVVDKHSWCCCLRTGPSCLLVDVFVSLLINHLIRRSRACSSSSANSPFPLIPRLLLRTVLLTVVLFGFWL